MAVGVFIKVLLSGGETAKGGKPRPKDEKGPKEWFRNKPQALAKLLS